MRKGLKVGLAGAGMAAAAFGTGEGVLHLIPLQNTETVAQYEVCYTQLAKVALQEAVSAPGCSGLNIDLSDGNLSVYKNGDSSNASEIKNAEFSGVIAGLGVLAGLGLGSATISGRKQEGVPPLDTSETIEA